MHASSSIVSAIERKQLECPRHDLPPTLEELAKASLHAYSPTQDSSKIWNAVISEQLNGFWQLALPMVADDDAHADFPTQLKPL